MDPKTCLMWENKHITTYPIMSQSSEESFKDSTHLNQQAQSKQTPPSKTIISASEIEKLYLRIKEDWL